MLRRRCSLRACVNPALSRFWFTTGASSDALGAVLQDQLQTALNAGTYKVERVLTSAQGALVDVRGSAAPVLNFCANNYLGLSNHPALVTAAHDALRSHGFGLSSVRFIIGTQDLHKALEARISAFHGTQDTILFPSCFDANAGLFESLLGQEDAVISDALNHASIIDGIRLCKARRLRYAHMDLADLEAKLVEARDARIRLIATDGVFSMDGDIAPLQEIIALARKHAAYVFVDECHATGVLGHRGRGTDEHCGVLGKVDIINSTLGKALGGATGGYTTGRKDVIDVLRQRARPYLFSNTIAPPIVAASLAAFDLLMGQPSGSTPAKDASQLPGVHMVQQLHANTAYFRARMAAVGFDIRPGVHPIVPIMVGEASMATRLASELLDEGVYVVGFSYPVVPKGAARVRVQVSAAHTRQHLDAAVAAFERVGRRLGLLPATAATLSTGSPVS